MNSYGGFTPLYTSAARPSSPSSFSYSVPVSGAFVPVRQYSSANYPPNTWNASYGFMSSQIPTPSIPAQYVNPGITSWPISRANHSVQDTYIQLPLVNSLRQETKMVNDNLNTIKRCYKNQNAQFY